MTGIDESAEFSDQGVEFLLWFRGQLRRFEGLSCHHSPHRRFSFGKVIFLDRAACGRSSSRFGCDAVCRRQELLQGLRQRGGQFLPGQQLQPVAQNVTPERAHDRIPVFDQCSCTEPVVVAICWFLALKSPRKARPTAFNPSLVAVSSEQLAQPRLQRCFYRNLAASVQPVSKSFTTCVTSGCGTLTVTVVSPFPTSPTQS